MWLHLLAEPLLGHLRIIIACSPLPLACLLPAFVSHFCVCQFPPAFLFLFLLVPFFCVWNYLFAPSNCLSSLSRKISFWRVFITASRVDDPLSHSYFRCNLWPYVLFLLKCVYRLMREWLGSWKAGVLGKKWRISFGWLWVDESKGLSAEEGAAYNFWGTSGADHSILKLAVVDVFWRINTFPLRLFVFAVALNLITGRLALFSPLFQFLLPASQLQQSTFASPRTLHKTGT